MGRKKKKKYKCKSGTKFIRDEDAQVIGEWIEFQGGFITADKLVDAARPKNSPLHHLFEWDNEQAAERWRRHSARMMLCCIVEIRDEKQVRSFHNVTLEDGSRVYANMERVIEEENLFDQVLEEAWRELQIWKKKYKDFKELREVMDAIEKTERKIKHGHTK